MCQRLQTVLIMTPEKIHSCLKDDWGLDQQTQAQDNKDSWEKDVLIMKIAT